MSTAVFNYIIILGALQGFTLCIFAFPKGKASPKARNAFTIFVFSLSFFNLIYGLYYLGVEKIGIVPISAFPFPYKYIIGPAFLFYIYEVVKEESKVFRSMKFLWLFLPALLYLFLRSYWYILVIFDINPNIIKQVYDTEFFTVNELVYLFFQSITAWLAHQKLRGLKYFRPKEGLQKKHFQWLNQLTLGFLLFTIVNFIFMILVIAFGLQHSLILYYIVLASNVVFIYWLGFQGFSKSDVIYNILKPKNNSKSLEATLLSTALKKLIEDREIIADQSLKIGSLANQLSSTEKELSSVINQHFGMNFSELINRKRVELVKQMMIDSNYEKYTLVHLGELAGFSSKSTFNSAFKKYTGQTPKAYKNR